MTRPDPTPAFEPAATTDAEAPPLAAASSPNLLRKLALSGFAAACEALFPDNDFGAPSWKDTDMVARAAQLWDELPPYSRLTLEALYAGLELGGAALVPGLGMLSGISTDKRFKMFDRMRRSRVWPLRFVAEAVKSSSTMVYLSHPLTLGYIGDQRNCLTSAQALASPRAPSPFTELISSSGAGREEAS